MSALIEQAWNAIYARQTLNPLPPQINLFTPFKNVYLANTYTPVFAHFINSIDNQTEKFYIVSQCLW